VSLDQIRRHYQGLDDETLLENLSHGQAGYATPEIWQIIVGEAQRRGLESSTAGSHDAPTTGSAVKTAAFADGVESSNSAESGTRYAILAHSDGRVQAVKQGFCWPAFFFTWVWAFIKGLYDLGIGVFLILVIVAIVGNQSRARAHDVIAILLPVLAGLSLRCVLGFEANRMRQKALLSKGFRLVGTVVANAPEEALAKAPVGARG